MKYRLRFQIERARNPRPGIADKTDWDWISARTIIVEAPDDLRDLALYEALAAAAEEKGLTRP